MDALIITVCSNRKRIEPAAELRASGLPPGRTEDVAADWLSRVAGAKQRLTVMQLYCGRAFVEAVACAKVCRGPLYVVSGGLGLVEGNARVPSYSLSIVAGSQDNVLTKLSGEERASQWWHHISRNTTSNRFHAILSERQDPLVLMALPSAYLKMIQGDLLGFTDAQRSRVRLFVYGGGETVDERLRCLMMPYDSRLDSTDSPLRGTRSDFAQRAMRHFVESVLPENSKGSAQQHAVRVEAALQGWTAPRSRHRTRATDEEIVALIRMHWFVANGQIGRMLRLLRDDLGVACEQRRLSQLFRLVRSEGGLVQ